MSTTYKKYEEWTQDRRMKLDPKKHDEIRERYKNGEGSWKTLAEDYGVSKKTIGLIVNEEMAKRNKKRVKEHWRDYYDKEDHRIAMRKFRAEKKRLGLTEAKTPKHNKICPVCNTPFQAIANKIYCSKKCKWNAAHERNRK